MSRLVPHSLQARLLLTFLTLNLLGIGGLVAWSARYIETDNIEQAEHELEIQSHLIADALRSPYEAFQSGASSPDGSLTSLVQLYARKNAVSVTVIDSKLKAVLSSDPSEPSQDIENKPEVQAAVNGTEEHDIRWNDNHTAQSLYVATAIINMQGVNEGYVQVSAPIAPVYADIQRTQLVLGAVGAILLIITALASLILARQIARPVSTLTRTSEAFAQGHLDERVRPAGPDEIRRLGSAFNQMAARISDMLVRQKEFVANAAHELRSPLTSIRLRLDLLRGSARGNPQVLERYLGQMDQEVDYLQSLVEKLLTLSALDANEQAPRVPLDLAPLVNAAIGEIEPLMDYAQLELDTNIPSHLPTCKVNAEQVHTILRNLLDNACKYSLPGGHITVRAECIQEIIYISVGDTGVGIPQEALPRIFDRFYRGDQARSGRRGSGLGLALVRSLTEANGGKIAVASEEGQGSVFTIQFPVCGL